LASHWASAARQTRCSTRPWPASVSALASADAPSAETYIQRMAEPMRDPLFPRPRPGRKPIIGKWTLFALLAALAAFMYGSIMMKIAGYGF